MSTRLTYSAVTNYKNVDGNDNTEGKVIVESYSDDGAPVFHLETMVKFLLGCGYGLELIKQYINTDGGEVWKIGE